ncbi:MAG: hypothetical protein WCI20_08010 [bacterium]
MPNARNDDLLNDRIWDRARKIASEEEQAFRKSLPTMPPEFVERIAGVVIRHEQRPSLAMVERGVDPDATCLTERDGKVIVLFLMSLYDRYGKFAGDYRRELRRILCLELADLAGVEWLGEQEA